jgi:hypothetical protein
VHQVKLFKGVESEVDQLEKDVNTWLAESGARVVNMFGNIAPQTMRPDSTTGSRAFPPSDIFLTVLYESA